MTTYHDSIGDRPVLSSFVQASLTETLGGPFEIWRRQSSGWRSSCNLISSLELEFANDDLWGWFDELLVSLQFSPQLRIGPSGTRLAAVVSESDDGEFEVVAGLVSLDQDQLITRAASTATRQFVQRSQQQLIDDYAERLSASYEELTFLRRFSQHIEYCVADNSLGDVAEEILTKLRGLLSVESLCLISASMTAEGVRANRVVSSDGILPESSSFWCEFVTRLGEANRRTLVRNFRGIQRRLPASVPPGTRSLAVVPIEKSGHIYGWLVAINKYVATSTVCSLGANELGSMEASLLEAAASMLGAQAANNRLFDEKESLIVEVIHTLVGVIESRDAYTCGHSDRVALFAQILAVEMGLSEEECQDIFLSGLLHDIGKVGVPDDVLLKPGGLSESEFNLIKRHPEIGARLLKGISALEKLIPGVMHHHEAIDGSGYPCGLKGEDIPLMARILAVADAFDAMTSDRPYRSGMTVERAVSVLRSGAGTQWDARVVDAFLVVEERILEVANGWQDHLEKLLTHRSKPRSQRPNLNKADFVAEFGSITGTLSPATDFASGL